MLTEKPRAVAPRKQEGSENRGPRTKNLNPHAEKLPDVVGGERVRYAA